MVCNSGTCTLDIADWDTQLCTTTIKVEKSQKVSSFLSCDLILQTRKLSQFKKIHFWCRSIQLSHLKNGFLCFKTKSEETKKKSTNIQIAWITIRAAMRDFLKQSAEVAVQWYHAFDVAATVFVFLANPPWGPWGPWGLFFCLFVCLKMDKKRKYLLRFGHLY